MARREHFLRILVLSAVALPLSSAMAAESENPLLSSEYRSSHTYEGSHPSFGVELNMTPWAFGGQAIIPNEGQGSGMGISIQSEWQPKNLQKGGVLGIGAVVDIFPMYLPSMNKSIRPILGGGAMLRYQFKYWDSQPVVPFGGYSAEALTYDFNAPTNNGAGTFFAHGPVFGAYFLLNFLDRKTSVQTYIDTGLKRTYLVAEGRMIMGGDGQVNLGGITGYFGIRLEM
ncbi:MAG: hypothetical protein ACXWP5_00030 [Bdellovibrionota bacterium]